MSPAWAVALALVSYYAASVAVGEVSTGWQSQAVHRPEPKAAGACACPTHTS